MKNITIHILNKAVSSTKVLMLGSVLLIGSLYTVEAQSISNPDFEILVTAGNYPTAASNMGKATGWTQPTGGSTDYFYGTPNPNDFRINISATGAAPYTTISAYSGAAYAGSFLEFGANPGSIYNNYKEYITNRLSTKLIAGVTYNITFYTMHLYGKSSTSGFSSMNYVDLLAAEQGYIGICFSAVSPTGSNTSTNGATPNNNNGGILNSWNPTKRALIPASNTTVYGAAGRNKWVPVTLTYTADGTEEYMTLGQWREGPTAMPSASIPNINAVYYLFDGFSPTVAPVASLSKKVFPNTIPDGGTATYTFTVNNTQSGSVALSGLSFTDTLPSGLKVASTPNVVVTGLTGGTTTATAGGTSVAASGYSIAANTTATITVNVTNVSGQLNVSCGSNPAAFTNSNANISGLSSNLNNIVGNICLMVVPCAAGSTAPVLSSGGTK